MIKKRMLFAAFLGVSAILFSPTKAQDCDLQPTLRISLIESADALTKCAAYAHVKATLYALGQAKPNVEAYEAASKISREATIVSTMLMVLANVAGADPTTKHDQYERDIANEITSAPSTSFDHYNQWCAGEMDKARQALLKTRDCR